jgi:Relaxase/Mobilisation nuclease domain
MPIIINGGSYRAGGWWGKHLQNGEKNERVQVVEFLGLTAETVPTAFREMEGVAAGTKCRNYFYQANINPREDEKLTPAQWREAIDTLEKNLGLAGQPRFVIEHEKKGRVHRHVIWSRVDADRMVAISDSLTAAIHERTSRELEIKFDLERGLSILTPNRDFERPERRPQKNETFRTVETGIDPETVKAELRALWQQADNGQSFKAALENQGYVLARGDRRDFVVIDRAGDDHSLARRLGVKAAKLRERMADIDRADLPSVAEAKTEQRTRPAAEPTRQEPDHSAEHEAGARARYDALRETEQQVARAQFEGPFPGKYDELKAATPPPEIVQQFEASASRTTEPRAPVYDRDAGNAEWEAKIVEAAIAAAETAPEVSKPEWEGDGLQSLDQETATEPAAPENASEATGTPNIEAAPEIAGDADSGVKGPESAVSGFLGSLAKSFLNKLGGFLGFLEPAAPKLSPHQAKLEARAKAEQSVENAAAREAAEKDAAFQQALAQIRRDDDQRRREHYSRYGTTFDRPVERDADGPDRGGGRDRD